MSNIKALLVGINYQSKPRLRLGGCANDVALAQSILTKQFHVPSSNITVIIDDEGHTPPTRDALLSALKSFIHSGRPNDILFFHYSGHGTKVTPPFTLFAFSLLLLPLLLFLWFPCSLQ